MKKRDDRRFRALVQQMYHDWVLDGAKRGISSGVSSWAEVHSEWKRIFYRWARIRLQEERQRARALPGWKNGFDEEELMIHPQCRCSLEPVKEWAE